MSNVTAATKSEKPISKQELNILFTCAGRRVALLEAFRCALRDAGVVGKVLTTDMTQATPAIV